MSRITPLADAPDIIVHLASRQLPSHPAVQDLIALAHEVAAAAREVVAAARADQPD